LQDKIEELQGGKLPIQLILIKDIEYKILKEIPFKFSNLFILSDSMFYVYIETPVLGEIDYNGKPKRAKFDEKNKTAEFTYKNINYKMEVEPESFERLRIKIDLKK
jgi:hypothetical protein